MYQHNDVIIIGGGAAGMAAAVTAAERHMKVLLLERGERPGRKILASGNGRCNLMNSGPPRYFGDPEFALTVLRHCPEESLKLFFRHYGLLLTEESDGRIYPYTHQSASVISILNIAMKTTGVQMITRTAAIKAEQRGKQFFVHTCNGTCYTSDKLIISCGGSVQPKLGGTSDGYRLLSSFGHTIIHQEPALVPLKTDRRSISGLSGIRVRCRVSVFDGERLLHQEKGEILFTDYGISGICIMQCARFTQGIHAHIELNLLDSAFENSEAAERELFRRRQIFCHESPLYLLNGITNEKLSYAIMKQANIPMHGEKAEDLTDEDISRITHSAYHYRIDITGTRGFDYAQVTAGGADCREFNPSSMSSRIMPGLYAAGEVLNVDGDCGGFNLMFAFSSGIIAGNSV